MKRLGTIPIRLVKYGSLFLLASIVALGIYCLASFNINYYNFGVVEKNKIYRSGQPDEEFLKHIIENYKIRAIITLRGHPRGPEQKIADEYGLKIYCLNLSVSREPNDDEVAFFLRIVGDRRNQPILVHCQAGADRTGLMIAIKRIEMDGWTIDEAEREMFYYRNIPFFVPMPREHLAKRYLIAKPAE